MPRVVRMTAARSADCAWLDASVGDNSDGASNGAGDHSTDCGWLGTSVGDILDGAPDGAGGRSMDCGWLGTSVAFLC